MSTRSLLAVTAAGALVFALVWGLLAAQTDIGTLFSFFGFTALLLAAVGLGAGLLSLRSNGRWALIAVGVPFAVVVAVALIVGIVNVRDAGRYVNKSQALVHAYAEMPRWGQQFKFINVDRAREVVKQWPAGEMAALYASGGQGEVARQLQNRFGIADADATKLASALNRQASGLSLWSWLEIVLTLFLGLLAAGVVLGRFIGVPMRWPAAAVTQAGGETLAAPADVAEATAAGEQNFEI